jgi:hypothetical protein
MVTVIALGYCWFIFKETRINLLEGSNSVLVSFSVKLCYSVLINYASCTQFHRFPRIQSSLLGSLLTRELYLQSVLFPYHMYITTAFLIGVTFYCACIFLGPQPPSHQS